MAELQEFVPEALVAPAGVLPGQPQDQRPRLRREGRAPQPTASAEGRPLAPHERAVPAQQRLRADGEPLPRRPRQEPAQGREEQAVAGAPAHSLDLSPEYPVLVPEDEQFDLASPRRRAAGQHHTEEQAAERVGD